MSESGHKESKEVPFNFENEIDIADWSLLRPHYQRGALFIVSKDLDLAMVARAVATDQVAQVKEWLSLEKLKQPELLQVQDFELDQYRELAHFVIVSPYVLIKLISQDEKAI